MKEVYDGLSAVVLEADELAWVYLDEAVRTKKDEAVQRNAALQKEANVRLKRNNMLDFEKETDMLAKHMESLNVKLSVEAKEPWRPEQPVLASEVLFCEKRFEAA